MFVVHITVDVCERVRVLRTVEFARRPGMEELKVVAGRLAAEDEQARVVLLRDPTCPITNGCVRVSSRDPWQELVVPSQLCSDVEVWYEITRPRMGAGVGADVGYSADPPHTAGALWSPGAEPQRHGYTASHTAPLAAPLMPQRRPQSPAVVLEGRAMPLLDSGVQQQPLHLPLYAQHAVSPVPAGVGVGVGTTAAPAPATNIHIHTSPPRADGAWVPAVQHSDPATTDVATALRAVTEQLRENARADREKAAGKVELDEKALLKDVIHQLKDAFASQAAALEAARGGAGGANHGSTAFADQQQQQQQQQLTDLLASLVRALHDHRGAVGLPPAPGHTHPTARAAPLGAAADLLAALQGLGPLTAANGSSSGGGPAQQWFYGNPPVHQPPSGDAGGVHPAVADADVDALLRAAHDVLHLQHLYPHGGDAVPAPPPPPPPLPAIGRLQAATPTVAAPARASLVPSPVGALWMRGLPPPQAPAVEVPMAAGVHHNTYDPAPPPLVQLPAAPELASAVGSPLRVGRAASPVPLHLPPSPRPVALVPGVAHVVDPLAPAGPACVPVPVVHHVPLPLVEEVVEVVGSPLRAIVAEPPPPPVVVVPPPPPAPIVIMHPPPPPPPVLPQPLLRHPASFWGGLADPRRPMASPLRMRGGGEPDGRFGRCASPLAFGVNVDDTIWGDGAGGAAGEEKEEKELAVAPRTPADVPPVPPSVTKEHRVSDLPTPAYPESAEKASTAPGGVDSGTDVVSASPVPTTPSAASEKPPPSVPAEKCTYSSKARPPPSQPEDVETAAIVEGRPVGAGGEVAGKTVSGVTPRPTSPRATENALAPSASTAAPTARASGVLSVTRKAESDREGAASFSAFSAPAVVSGVAVPTATEGATATAPTPPLAAPPPPSAAVGASSSLAMLSDFAAKLQTATAVAGADGMRVGSDVPGSLRQPQKDIPASSHDALGWTQSTAEGEQDAGGGGATYALEDTYATTNTDAGLEETAMGRPMSDVSAGLSPPDPWVAPSGALRKGIPHMNLHGHGGDRGAGGGDGTFCSSMPSASVGAVSNALPEASLPASDAVPRTPVTPSLLALPVGAAGSAKAEGERVGGAVNNSDNPLLLRSSANPTSGGGGGGGSSTFTSMGASVGAGAAGSAAAMDDLASTGGGGSHVSSTSWEGGVGNPLRATAGTLGPAAPAIASTSTATYNRPVSARASSLRAVSAYGPLAMATAASKAACSGAVDASWANDAPGQHSSRSANNPLSAPVDSTQRSSPSVRLESVSTTGSGAASLTNAREYRSLLSRASHLYTQRECAGSRGGVALQSTGVPQLVASSAAGGRAPTAASAPTSSRARRNDSLPQLMPSTAASSGPASAAPDSDNAADEAADAASPAAIPSTGPTSAASEREMDPSGEVRPSHVFSTSSHARRENDAGGADAGGSAGTGAFLSHVASGGDAAQQQQQQQQPPSVPRFMHHQSQPQPSDAPALSSGALASVSIALSHHRRSTLAGGQGPLSRLSAPMDVLSSQDESSASAVPYLTASLASFEEGSGGGARSGSAATSVLTDGAGGTGGAPQRAQQGVDVDVDMHTSLGGGFHAPRSRVSLAGVRRGAGADASSDASASAPPGALSTTLPGYHMAEGHHGPHPFGGHPLNDGAPMPTPETGPAPAAPVDGTSAGGVMSPPASPTLQNRARSFVRFSEAVEVRSLGGNTLTDTSLASSGPLPAAGAEEPCDRGHTSDVRLSDGEDPAGNDIRGVLSGEATVTATARPPVERVGMTPYPTHADLAAARARAVRDVPPLRYPSDADGAAADAPARDGDGDIVTPTYITEMGVASFKSAPIPLASDTGGTECAEGGEIAHGHANPRPWHPRVHRGHDVSFGVTTPPNTTPMSPPLARQHGAASPIHMLPGGGVVPMALRGAGGNDGGGEDDGGGRWGCAPDVDGIEHRSRVGDPPSETATDTMYYATLAAAGIVGAAASATPSNAASETQPLVLRDPPIAAVPAHTTAAGAPRRAFASTQPPGSGAGAEGPGSTTAREVLAALAERSLILEGDENGGGGVAGRPPLRGWQRDVAAPPTTPASPPVGTAPAAGGTTAVPPAARTARGPPQDRAGASSTAAEGCSVWDAVVAAAVAGGSGGAHPVHAASRGSDHDTQTTDSLLGGTADDGRNAWEGRGRGGPLGPAAGVDVDVDADDAPTDLPHRAPSAGSTATNPLEAMMASSTLYEHHSKARGHSTAAKPRANAVVDDSAGGPSVVADAVRHEKDGSGTASHSRWKEAPSGVGVGVEAVSAASTYPRPPAAFNFASHHASPAARGPAQPPRAPVAPLNTAVEAGATVGGRPPNARPSFAGRGTEGGGGGAWYAGHHRSAAAAPPVGVGGAVDPRASAPRSQRSVSFASASGRSDAFTTEPSRGYRRLSPPRPTAAGGGGGVRGTSIGSVVPQNLPSVEQLPHSSLARQRERVERELLQDRLDAEATREQRRRALLG